MNTIFKISRQDLHISLIAAIGLLLLILRVYLSSQISYLFLVWNLFLAAIPYVLVRWLRFRESENPLFLFTIASLWLLFLPNAPYLVTDFIHLTMQDNPFFWLDILMLSSLSWSGLYLGYLSTRMLEEKLSKSGMIPNKQILYIFRVSTLGLCSLGMYLGRILRWNSWDIARRPRELFMDVTKLFIDPIENYYAWCCILSFSALLLTFYLIFDHLAYENNVS